MSSYANIAKNGKGSTSKTTSKTIPVYKAKASLRTKDHIMTMYIAEIQEKSGSQDYFDTILIALSSVGVDLD